MADSEGNEERVERRLAELTSRISELEARIAEIETRPATTELPAQPAQAQLPPQAAQEPYPWLLQETWRQREGWIVPEPQRRTPATQPTQPTAPTQQTGPSPVIQPTPVPPPSVVTATPASSPRVAAYADGSTRHGEEHAAPAARPAAAAVPPPARPAGPRAPSELPPEGSGISLQSVRDLEARLTGRLLAWVGAAAVLLGAIFFLSLAFSRGWIGPEARVILGLVGGEAFTVIGAWLLGRRQASLGRVMVAVGLGVISLALFAGTRYYDLYSPELALAGSFAAAVETAAIAVRYDSESVAIFGLVAIAAAPPIMGAGANTVTIAFLGVTIVGTTLVSLAKSWRWLPPTAFIITAPQLVYWLAARPDAPTAVAAIAAYWFLFSVAASADQLRVSSGEPPRSNALFLANSILAIGGGLFVLSGGLSVWQGSFMAVAALAHFGFGAFFIWRRGEVDPFGLFINAIGAAAVALAIERQFNGPAVVIGWSVEAAVLAVVFGLRRNVYAGGAAALLGTLPAVHLALYEYPFIHWTLEGRSGTGPFAFADGSGLALAGLLIAGFVAGRASHRSDVRVALLIPGSVLTAYSLPFELSGPALVAGWALVGAGLAGAWQFRRVGYLGVTAVGIGAMAVVHLSQYEYPFRNWLLQGATGPGPVPFANEAGLALAAVLGALALAGWLARTREARYSLLVGGSLLVAYVLPFELSGPALVAGWCAEGVALVAIWGWRHNIGVAAAVAVAGALALANFVGFEYPSEHWWLNGVTGPGPLPFADAAGIALGVLLVAAVLTGILSRSHDVRCAMTTGGLLLVAYSLPFELSGVALVAGLAVLLPGSIAAEALLDRLPGVPESRAALRKRAVVEMNEVHWPDTPLVAAGTAAVLVVAHLLMYEMPLSSTDVIVVPVTPFADLASASMAIGIAAFLVAAAITARPDIRVGAIVVAASLAAYAMPFELALPYAVVVWCALAVALGAWSFAEKFGRWVYVGTGAVFVGVAAATILAQVDPPWRLGVQASVPSAGIWFAVDSIVAIVATAATVAAAARFLPLDKDVRLVLNVAAGIAMIFLASTLVVDVFQSQLGGRFALEELQKQAQVSVSILWGVIGMAVFLVGVIGWRQGVREGGLSLLALATAKVFVFDLSYLDVAYRVLSLIGLGLLLLAGAYAYQTLRPHRLGPGDTPHHAPVK